MQNFLGRTREFEHLPFEATEILVEDGGVAGVRTRDGSELRARSVVITSGTFLRAVMHTGFEQTSGGRLGGLAAMIKRKPRKLGLQIGPPEDRNASTPTQGFHRLRPSRSPGGGRKANTIFVLYEDQSIPPPSSDQLLDYLYERSNP